MVILVNESSISEHVKCGVALRLFWEAATELSGKAKLLKDSAFFGQSTFKQRFGAMLAEVPKEIRPLIRQVAFSDRYWKCWRPTRISTDSDPYVCQTPKIDLLDNSLCEAAEKALHATAGEIGMISAQDSSFGKLPNLKVTKIGSNEEVELHNTDSIESLRQWLAQQRGYYDRTSAAAPRDFQTILEKDTSRFRRTARLQFVANNYRRVYEEAATGRFYYVDDGHPGVSAHLEVFDAERSHLGEADIDSGIVDVSKREAGRKMTP